MGGSGVAISQSDRGLKIVDFVTKMEGWRIEELLKTCSKNHENGRNSQSECASGIRLNFSETFKNSLKRNRNGEVAKWEFLCSTGTSESIVFHVLQGCNGF